MIKSNFKTKEKLEEFYNNLNGKCEGYIQLSGKRINVLSPACELPKWDKITTKSNFIYEAAFFDEENNISTLIRQIDDKWLVNTVNLRELEKNDDYDVEKPQSFIAKTGGKVKMINIWQEEKDELCGGFPVLKHVYSAFVGFDTHPDSSSHPSQEGNLNGENNNKGGK